MQVDDFIRTYKNETHASHLMREDANTNMVSLIHYQVASSRASATRDEGFMPMLAAHF